MYKNINLEIEENRTVRKIDFKVINLFCCGFTGRNQDAVKAHVDEMRCIGVPCPDRIPDIYHVSPYLLTNETEIDVVGKHTSGEVESVFLLDHNQVFLTVGSDHTDREIERLNYQKSKQICSKIISNHVWKFSEVDDHFDDLLLRSEVVKNGKQYLYQEGKVSIVMKPFDVINHFKISDNKTVFFSGTIPTKTKKIIHADYYMIEIFDPILNRRITHSYKVRVI